MRKLFVFAVLASVLGAAAAVGLGANDRRYVDAVNIEPSGATTLLLVIDRPLEDGLTKQSAKRKLLGYKQWVDDPKFDKAFPAARRSEGVVVVIAHFAPKNELGRSVIEQVEGYARELGFKPRLKVVQAKERAQ